MIKLSLLTIVVVYIASLTSNANSYLRSPLSLTTLFSLKLVKPENDQNANTIITSISELEKLDDLGFQLKSKAIEIQLNDESATLVRDIDLLVNILGNIIKRENSNVFGLYEKFKAHALARSNDDKEALSRMIQCGIKITPEDAMGVARAFTQTLNLINAAEVHNRMRTLQLADKNAEVVSPLPMREDSVAGTINKLLTSKSESFINENTEDRKKQIFNALLKQKVDIVLTAHPTEVNRRTLLRKYRSITEILGVLDRRELTPYERAQTLESLRREVASIWGSDEIRRKKPSPQQEARGGLAILESVLWDAVPSYLRKLNAQCIESLGQELPLDHVPIRFSSWMGGDRDGNPNVTPAVTLQVSITQRLQAARLLLKDITELYGELAVCKGFTNEMLSLAAEVIESKDVFELYRRVLGHIKLRLLSTINWCESELTKYNDDVVSGSATSAAAAADISITKLQIECEKDNCDSTILGSPSKPFFDSEEILAPLKIIHNSLVSGGYSDVADGLLIDIIRRVATFGLTLAPLDIRQESTRHTQALDSICRYLGIGSYAQWDEQTKINWLSSELSGKRPLFRTRDIDSLGFDANVLDTLKTLEVASLLGPESLGAYVISQSKAASDVLAVALLQKQFGMTATNGKMMRVVPLFETLDDLTNSASIVETLFSAPSYVGMIKGKQEIMVGYSDSAKDAGRLAACWAQYESQEKMVKVAAKFGIELTFFHGKGGTVGRGGNPALYRAVLAHPPKTINGKFRVTEQGEMITQNFGSTGIAERTMDIYTAAILAEKFLDHVDPKPEWRECLDKLSVISCDAYRQTIQKQAFISYFRKATPELELGSLNIGSRPAKRNPKGGIESLRAIPWQFAWTQTRLHLPAWLGVGDALEVEGEEKAKLRTMYDKWPFFREMIDLIAMTLSKTDYSISANYEMQLVNGNNNNNEELKALGDEIRKSLVKTRKNVLSVTGCDDLSSGFKLLQQSMKVIRIVIICISIFTIIIIIIRSEILM